MFQFNVSFSTLAELRAFVENIESKPDEPVKQAVRAKTRAIQDEKAFLEAIETPVSSKLRKGYHQNKGKGWSPDEDAYIMENRSTKSYAAIAKVIGRTAGSVNARAWALVHKDDAKRPAKRIKVHILDDEQPTQSALLDGSDEDQSGLYIAERPTETVEPKKS